MSRPGGVRRLFVLRRRRRWVEDEVDVEMEHHLEMRSEELVEAGHTAAEARRIAEAAFGDRRRHAERCVAERRREARVTWWREGVSAVAGDVRHALRGVRKAPGFATAVVLTLGLGIGANTAIFTVVDALLLKPLPFHTPGELYGISARYDEGAFEMRFFPAPAARAFLGLEVPGLSVAASARTLAVRTDGEEAEALFVEALTPGLTDLLGVAPAWGRSFNQDDAVPGAGAVVLLSHAY